jgi:hypothetical protein
MEKTSVSGLTLFFDPRQEDAAELIRNACGQSVRLIQERWGLAVPQDCRVYVMTSWLHFTFHAPPWPWKIWSGLTLPLWAWRAQRIWRYAGGWTQRYGRRRAVGVKPPWLLAMGDWSLGERLFEPEADITQKVRQVTCHELVHAFTAHLRLPVWLREGLAMVTVDYLAGKATVRADTLGMLEGSPGGGQRKRPKPDWEALIGETARGYWTTRYIAETKPEHLRSLLRERHKQRELEEELAQAYGLEAGEFWRIQEKVMSRFGPGETG